MCGICGFVTKGINATASTLVQMNTSLKHRGPDDEGYFCLTENNGAHFTGDDSIIDLKAKVPHINPDQKINAGLGFRRLSIIDLSAAGHQPMMNDAQSIVLTFNGQIYNYKALRQELEEKGFHFKSTADTEVILRGYECWGKDVVYRLNGMFAFAIMDLTKNIVWLVRDRIGVKPLFYHQSSSDITWASEMKAILKAPWVKATVNPAGLIGNYYLQTSPSPLTCFQNIQSVQPATWLEVNLKTLEAKEFTYWDVPVGERKANMQLIDATHELDARLQASVKMQLNSDVPLISMMSGGIDSTTITAMGHKMDDQLKCYSCGIDGSGVGMDELPQAVAMAKKIGIEQITHLFKTDDLIHHLDKDLRHSEDPYTAPDSMLTPSEHLSKLGYKVLLSGNGADEIFGGYGHFLSLEQWVKRKRFSKVGPIIPAIHPFLKKVKNYMEADTAFKYFANSRACMRPYQIKQLMHQKEWSHFNELTSYLPQDESRFENEYEALYYYEMKYSIGSHHVFRDDLSAMSHSVEMRYPYLDHTIIEWVSQLPLSLRYNRKTNKPLLRAAAAPYIDSKNLSMPKKGFNLPVETWWNHNKAVRDYMETKLTSLEKRGIFNNKTIQEWKSKSSNAFDLSKIWQLVTTEVWLQTYID
jgi:asparagine synthase (glutamine-hydrolysing)